MNSKGIWFAFEGELGTVELLDKSNNVLGLCILSTNENWMVKGSVEFNCLLEYRATNSGEGTLVVKNNNASGKPELDKSFSIRVFYTKTE